MKKYLVKVKSPCFSFDKVGAVMIAHRYGTGFFVYHKDLPDCPQKRDYPLEDPQVTDEFKWYYTYPNLEVIEEVTE